METLMTSNVISVQRQVARVIANVAARMYFLFMFCNSFFFLYLFFKFWEEKNYNKRNLYNIN